MHQETVKRVYIEPAWKLHLAYRELINNSPQGYKFFSSEGIVENISKKVSHLSFAHVLMTSIYQVLPAPLLKSVLDVFLNKKPKNVSLTFSCYHLVFRKEPWVVEMGTVRDLVGSRRIHLKIWHKLIEHSFASPYCKKILFWNEMGKQTILTSLNCSNFIHKIEVVPRTVKVNKFEKVYNNNSIKILFVGSANIRGEFELRGGKEVLEAFSILSRKYNNIELIMRTDIPQLLKDKYKNMAGLTLIDTIISQEELQNVFESADMFLFPGHYSSWLVILEAMSYELPVIATDVDCSPELICDGYNGFLIQKSKIVPYWQDGKPLPEYDAKFHNATKKTDPIVIAQLVEKICILIENPELRRKVGKQARWEIENGKFSTIHRNEVLKRILDEATNIPE